MKVHPICPSDWASIHSQRIRKSRTTFGENETVRWSLRVWRQHWLLPEAPYVASFAQDVQEAASQVPPNPIATASQTLDPTANAASFLFRRQYPRSQTVSVWLHRSGDNKTDNAQAEPTAQPRLLRALSPLLVLSLPQCYAQPGCDSYPERYRAAHCRAHRFC